MEDYRKSGLPMLPVTHGNEFTRLQILLYTIVLFAACLMPFAYGMSSWLYLAAALVLSAGFTWYGFRLWREYSDALARKTFRFSLIHLSVLFAALLVDHYLLLTPCSDAPFSSPGAGAAALAGCAPDGKPQFKAVDITGADYAKDFPLPDAEGGMRSIDDFQGKAVVVFFGYTQCPDVCPTTLTEIAEAKKLLGPDGDKVQGVFITVDPERDQPEVLKAYMASFGPDFVALRGTPEQTAAVAKDFKVFYRRVEGKTPGSYFMEHTAASYVYDPQGRLRLYVRYGGGAQALADDLKLLLKGLRRVQHLLARKGARASR